MFFNERGRNGPREVVYIRLGEKKMSIEKMHNCPTLNILFIENFVRNSLHAELLSWNVFLVRFPDFNQKQQICLNFPEIPIKYIQFPSPSRNWIRSYAEAVTKCSFAIHQIGNPTRSIRDQILIGHFGETDIQHFPTFSRRSARLKNQSPDLRLT